MRESGNDLNMPSEDGFSPHQQDARRFSNLPTPRLAQPTARPRPAERRSRKSEPARGRKPATAPALNGKNLAADRAPSTRAPLKFDEKLKSGPDRLREQRDRRRNSTQAASSTGNRRLKPVPNPATGTHPQRRSRSPRKLSRLSASAPPRPRTRSGTAIVYGTRLLILGVGLGVLAGTILSAWDSARYFTAGASSPEKTEQTATVSATPADQLPMLTLGQEMLPLKNNLQALVAQQTQLSPGMMIVDLDTNAYLNINASVALPCASTIKLPILVAFFQDVDAGKIRLDEMLTMRSDLIATESGEMQYQPVGSQFSALETATKMITVSDNTATNLLIDRLGGKEALTQRFQSWGLTSTAIQNRLPDVEGTNTSSSQDLVTLLGLVSNGKLLSMRSRDRMLDLMRHTVNNSLLPSGLGEGATISHKTGSIGSMIGDVGLIDMPSGKRYLIAAMVKRPRNDERAEELIRQVSRLTYQYFSQPAPAQTSGNSGQPNQPPVSPQTNPQGTSLQRTKVAQP
ncbi:serine hydrolase [Phormidesmis priestleyi ULC007]|uniref:Serine hydrolase n=1 Tax=Phormidesmis priestleyi ULC007 TaxID=1920490 RepID=A0A2T1D5T2_9CYAN|nr:serine hydrolase [Phormidesmis priestleyi]PSB15885.1 serine hydrolase [Phormidesmis priestleyi ULC007]PZO53502.1 MAG: serine hydrolase [Phormidesmis priestleyi]